MKNKDFDHCSHGQTCRHSNRQVEPDMAGRRERTGEPRGQTGYTHQAHQEADIGRIDRRGYVDSRRRNRIQTCMIQREQAHGVPFVRRKGVGFGVSTPTARNHQHGASGFQRAAGHWALPKDLHVCLLCPCPMPLSSRYGA